MTTPFDKYWVEKHGGSPVGHVQATIFEEAKRAWEAACPGTMEAYKTQAIMLRGALRERDEAVAKAQKHKVPTVGKNVPLRKTLLAVADEVCRARKKFPSNQHLLAALGEEYGELCKAYLENEGKDRVYAEAKQVACVAIRIMEEGDSDFDE